MIPRAHIARAFGRAAARYDQYADLQRQVADQLLSSVAIHSASPLMLDLGCGTGYCSFKLSKQFPDGDLVVLDMALPMLQATQRHRIPACVPVCADAQALPLRDKQFDLVVSNLTIQWCVRIESLFAELFRIARPGAKLFITTFGPSTLQEVKNAWARIDGHVHVNEFVPLATLTQCATAAGFCCQGRAELVRRSYASMQAVGKELKGLGAYNMNSDQARGFTTRKALAMAEKIFAEGHSSGRIPVTFEMFYLELQKPHSVANATR